jgi:feruloyl esterase
LFLGLGSGGFGGYIDYGALALRLGQGYAAANTGLGTGVSGCTVHYCGSDGNQGNPFAIAYGDPTNPALGLFGHPERIKDYGHRAIHLMTVRGKEIVKAFYQQDPNRSYFFGCSTGGQNALMEAQRYPDDYDGIVAGAAAFNRSRLFASAPYAWLNTHVTPGRFIQTGQMSLINKAVLAKCAGQDGGVPTDPFLTDPRDCYFGPKVLLCTGGNVPPACLTDEQVTTMQHYYAGTIDPVNGDVIVPASARGSETEDLSAAGLAFRERLPEPLSDGAMYWVFGPTFGQASGAVNYLNFDIHRDIKAIDDMLAAPLNADSTDLSAFRKHGGKLIIYHGWADPLIPSQTSINYFNALVEHDRHHFGDEHRDDGIEEVRFDREGGRSALRRTQSYARLYMIPGMFHCAGGPGPNSFVLLPSLVDWVENGTVPGTVIATKYFNDTPPVVQMTRPLCVFPKVAKYNGSGGTNDAANFTCVPDQNDFNQKPAPQYGP